MRITLRSTVFLALGASHFACSTATGAAVPLVRAHAARDLDCPEQHILVSEELGWRYKAAGCGRKAYYRTACDGLACVVRGDDEGSIPWRDRPDPMAPDRAR